MIVQTNYTRNGDKKSDECVHVSCLCYSKFIKSRACLFKRGCSALCTGISELLYCILQQQSGMKSSLRLFDHSFNQVSSFLERPPKRKKRALCSAFADFLCIKVRGSSRALFQMLTGNSFVTSFAKRQK